MIDLHVHFFPARVFHAVWSFFETQGRGLWSIPLKVHGAELAATLRGHGVERFTSLVYAHKPGMAAFLNDFIVHAAVEFPELIPFGTIYAGDGDTGATARLIFETHGFAGIKLHPFVSREMLDDPRFFPAYELMEATGKVLICHPGSGPVYPLTDGDARLRTVLNQFPNLKVVVAHCGAFEYDAYPPLAEEFEHVYFDTAMNCVHADVFRNNCPGRDFFVRFQDRIVFGSDFPNIPYEYADQVSALRALGLGADIERKLFSENARRLLKFKENDEA